MNRKEDESIYSGVLSSREVMLALTPAVLQLIVQLVGYFFNIERIGAVAVVATGLLSSILVLFGIYFLVIAMKAKHRKLRLMADEAEAKLKARKAASFDYKMTASVESETFKRLVKRLDKGYGCDIMKMRDGQVLFFETKNDAYVSIGELLSRDAEDGFRAVPLRNKDKAGKCIVQVSFIPLDEDGRMPLILRMPESHARDVSISQPKPVKLTFVSFSPVPMSYDRPFDLVECYHREVPDRTGDVVDCDASRFTDCGIALKCEWDGDSVRYYLFYVFTVRYSGVKFADENGALNQMGINRIFAVDPDASAGHVEYFRKDHERIIAAANAFDVYNALSKDGNKAEVNPCLRNLFEQMDFAVCCGDDESSGRGKIVEHFDLTTAELGPVEMRIVQKLML